MNIVDYTNYFGSTTTDSSYSYYIYDDVMNLSKVKTELEEKRKSIQKQQKEKAHIPDDEWDVLMKNLRATQ